MLRRTPALLLLALACAPAARAASFDVATEYRMRPLAYKNLNLNSEISNDQSFISQRARVAFTLKDIGLGEYRGESQSMDMSIRLHAIGVAGSSTPFHAAPFDKIATHYPNTSFSPFIENAFMKVRNLAGFPWETTFGIQTFSLGSGLLLDDDGVGLTGVSAKGKLPWLGMNGQVFLFQARNSQQGPNDLDVYGFSLDLPSEGTWQLNQLIEKDQATQYAMVNGCASNAAVNPGGECLISKASRYFTSVRYTLNYGPMVFDGEVAMQKGVATPTGPTPAGNHITYNGNAQVLKAKWKQPLWSNNQGIVRIVLARGSGDRTDTPTTDEAFFPSQGHRYDGLERTGFGEFFASTPYDAFGGQSTATANSLQRGASGIVTVGLGVTPPAYRGIVFDIDYFVYRLARNYGANFNLGTEMDFRLRYDVFDRFSLKASLAMFSIGSASNPYTKGSARRYMLEASGKF
ncbi:MAG TPA: hypothetical protein DCM05_08785 [Elusimicrobia bacterium]|nr:hypothetical protein [Elusimicrobiota bacterium]